MKSPRSSFLFHLGRYVSVAVGAAVLGTLVFLNHQHAQAADTPAPTSSTAATAPAGSTGQPDGAAPAQPAGGATAAPATPASPPPDRYISSSKSRVLAPGEPLPARKLPTVRVFNAEDVLLSPADTDNFMASSKSMTYVRPKPKPVDRKPSNPRKK